MSERSAVGGFREVPRSLPPSRSRCSGLGRAVAMVAAALVLIGAGAAAAMTDSGQQHPATPPEAAVSLDAATGPLVAVGALSDLRAGSASPDSAPAPLLAGDPTKPIVAFTMDRSPTDGRGGESDPWPAGPARTDQTSGHDPVVRGGACSSTTDLAVARSTSLPSLVPPDASAVTAPESTRLPGDPGSSYPRTDRARSPSVHWSPGNPIHAERPASGAAGSARAAGWSTGPAAVGRWLDDLSPDVSRIRC